MQGSAERVFTAPKKNDVKKLIGAKHGRREPD
jgi:hypothetical protein